MPQGNEKSSNESGIPTKDSDHDLSIGSDSKDQRIFDKQKSNVKEDLEPCKSADDMPELENNQELENDEQVTLDISEPPPEVMEYARRELGETEEVKCQTLQEFRDMIYGNSNWNVSLKQSGKSVNAVKSVQTVLPREKYNRKVLA